LILGCINRVFFPTHRFHPTSGLTELPGQLHPQQINPSSLFSSSFSQTKPTKKENKSKEK
jgi:hypothetical protein